MAEEGIGSVVTSLKDLNTATINSAVEFQGFTKSLTRAADATSKAGKNWTIFSRLVSGTPLWAFQNKLRAYLSILGNFEEKSKANSKALSEEARQMVERFHAGKKVNEEQQKMNSYMKGAIELQVKHKKTFEEVTHATKNRRISIEKLQEKIKEEQKSDKKAIRQQKHKLNAMYKYAQQLGKNHPLFQEHIDAIQKQADEADRASKFLLDDEKRRIKHAEAVNAQREAFQGEAEAIEDAVKHTKEYVLAISAGASEQMAFAEGTLRLNDRFKDLQVQEKALVRVAKEAYAFDEKRVSTRKKLATRKAKAAGKGRIGQALARGKAGRKEKAQMDREQKTIMSTLAGEKGDDAIKTIGEELGMVLKGIGAPLFAMHKLAKSRRKMQIKLLKFTNSLKGVLDIAFRYFMFGVFAVIGFMALIPVFFAIKDMIKPFAGDIKHFGGRLIDFGKDIFGVIKTFMDSGFDEGIKQLGPLFDTGLQLLIDFGNGLLIIGQALLFGLIDMAIEFVYKFFTDAEFREPIIERLLQIAKIVLAVWFVKTLAANAIQLIGIYLLPAMIGIVIAAVLYRTWMFLVSKYAETVDVVLTGLYEYIMKIGDYIVEVAKGSMKFINWFKSGKWLDDLADAIEGVFDLLHTGGVASGGATIVGERGPEMLKLPKGSRVYTNQQSKSMAGRGAGNVINNYITINAKDTSDAELRRIADRIGNMVNSKINRTTSSRTLG